MLTAGEEGTAGRNPADAPGTATTPFPRPGRSGLPAAALRPLRGRLAAGLHRYATGGRGYQGQDRKVPGLPPEAGTLRAQDLITHGRTEPARFLGYEIVVHNNDAKHDRHGHRSINAAIGLKVPMDVVRAGRKPYLRRGKPAAIPVARS